MCMYVFVLKWDIELGYCWEVVLGVFFTDFDTLRLFLSDRALHVMFVKLKVSYSNSILV